MDERVRLGALWKRRKLDGACIACGGVDGRTRNGRAFCSACEAKLGHRDIGKEGGF